ncbi:leucine-rich repeat-containing protein 59 isoform X2 [Cimex lectularius]|uniref:Leucine-rich repeat-containing protein 59 n=1 Tax=Cimex lectularius TaxID=79782 RepID=A0A8I6RKD0_CIMLE|nr:leucine-rich repeat-containing protein 59 isoform X2 [Cimex lectularius]
MKKKINIKEYFDDDNSIDLSLGDLEEVPVKEIATIPKAVFLDLSSNRITSLGNNFSTLLTHLVKLDLSQNRITELPENFGLLIHLKYLDLYQNRLQALPHSFSDLRSLRWLDLKDNPLTPSLAKVVGHCQDSQACQTAAKNAVRHMTQMRNIAIEENKMKQEQKRKHGVFGVHIMVKNLEKQKEQQQLTQKKENKKKKKKKNNTKSTEQAAELFTNEDILLYKEVMYGLDDMLTEEKRPLSIFRTGWSFIRSIVKVIFIFSLIFGLAMFGLSVFDHGLYKQVSSTIIKNANRMRPSIPKSQFLNSAYKLFYESVKSVSAMLRQNILNLGIYTVNTYNFLTTDEQVQLYVGIFKENIHIAYIKTVDTLSVMYSKLHDYMNTEK